MYAARFLMLSQRLGALPVDRGQLLIQFFEFVVAFFVQCAVVYNRFLDA